MILPEAAPFFDVIDRDVFKSPPPPPPPPPPPHPGTSLTWLMDAPLNHSENSQVCHEILLQKQSEIRGLSFYFQKRKHD